MAACAVELVGFQIPWDLQKPIKEKVVGALKYNAVYKFPVACFLLPQHFFFLCVCLMNKSHTSNKLISIVLFCFAFFFSGNCDS